MRSEGRAGALDGARKGISDRTMLAEQTEKTGTAAVEELPLNQWRPRGRAS